MLLRCAELDALRGLLGGAVMPACECSSEQARCPMLRCSMRCCSLPASLFNAVPAQQHGSSHCLHA